MTLPAFVINLDRSPDRWRFMAGHVGARGFDVRRTVAVDGAALTDADIARLTVAVPGVRALARNEIACFESHKRAWSELIASRAPWGLVLEDDVFLAAETAALAAAIVAAAPAGIVKLNSYEKPIYVQTAPVWQGDGHRLLRPAQKTIDGSAYLMSRPAAEAALARFARYSEELDISLFDPATGIAVAQVVPALAVQQKFADFDFLNEAAKESALETGRAAEQVALKRARPRRGLGQIVGAELRRFWRRRLEPRAVQLANPFRPADRRLAHLLIGFPSDSRGAS